MARRLAALALPGLLVSSCAGFPFSTDEDDPGTVVGKKSVVVKNGRIPYDDQFIGIDLPDGTVVPMNIVVDKHGRKYEELDLAEMNQISKERESNPTNPSARHPGVESHPAGERGASAP